MATRDELQENIFNTMAERALMARAFILLQSVFFIALVNAWHSPRDENMFGVSFLLTGHAFAFAGILGVFVVLFPRHRLLVVVWLTAVGFACLGRMSHVLGNGDFTPDEKWRALGWIPQWSAALLGIIQVWTAEVIRGRRPWNG